MHQLPGPVDVPMCVLLAEPIHGTAGDDRPSAVRAASLDRSPAVVATLLQAVPAAPGSSNARYVAIGRRSSSRRCVKLARTARASACTLAPCSPRSKQCGRPRFGGAS
jgi:hypothetical protein